MNYHCEIIEDRVPAWTRVNATTTFSSMSPIIVVRQVPQAVRSESQDELNEREWGWSKRWERMYRIVREFSRDAHGDY